MFEKQFLTKQFEFAKSPFRSNALLMCDGKKQLAFDKRSGHWYAADKSKLCTSQIKGEVPKQESVVEITNNSINNFDMLPSSKAVRFEQIAVAETAIGEDSDDPTKRRVLPTTDRYK